MCGVRGFERGEAVEDQARRNPVFRSFRGPDIPGARTGLLHETVFAGHRITGHTAKRRAVDNEVVVLSPVVQICLKMAFDLLSDRRQERGAQRGRDGRLINRDLRQPFSMIMGKSFFFSSQGTGSKARRGCAFSCP